MKSNRPRTIHRDFSRDPLCLGWCRNWQSSVAVRGQQASATAIYLPLRSLLDYPPAALLEAIEAADLIAFDDVDCIDVSREWQEALFHAHNRCQAANTSMLFSATLAPSALDSILPDLRSRFAASAVFHANLAVGGL